MSVKADFVFSTHPGEILQLMLDELEITQTRLAKHIRVTQSKVSELCSGRRGISAEMAIKLGKAFSQDPRFWLDAQQRWELSQIDASEIAVKPLVVRKIQGDRAA